MPGRQDVEKRRLQLGLPSKKYAAPDRSGAAFLKSSTFDQRFEGCFSTGAPCGRSN
jgi:hypothetical protein